MTPDQPVLIFDGDCGFCRRWINRWKASAGDTVRFVPRQEAESWLPPEVHARSASAVQLLLPDGEILEGARAVFEVVSSSRLGHVLLNFYLKFPLFASASEFVYRIIARNRVLFSTLFRGSDFVLGTDPNLSRTNVLFLRALGLIYAVAFGSLALQIPGLIGSHGISPAHMLVEASRELGPERFWLLPSLCLFHVSDGFLLFLGWGGMLGGLLLAGGAAPFLLCGLLWVFYLSLVSVGGVFLSFQWDTLLLEAGFLAILLAPCRWWVSPRHLVAPSRVAIWAVRLLVFRFMLFSGLVKLLSGDTVWRDFTALQYHYWSQPLPHALSWWTHQLPAWFHSASCIGMFAVELIVPFLIFFGRIPRAIAALAMILLQTLIILTGNYGFFNWLTIVICIPLFDDRAFPRLFRSQASGITPSLPSFFRQAVTAGIACILITLGLLHSIARIAGADSLPTIAQAPMNWTRPFGLVNDYGAFAIMTKSRPEIIIEGSRDGLTWIPYEFKYKPGDIHRTPPFVAPYQPRLDWQMWFAALEAPRVSGWFRNLLYRLLHAQPEVLALLEKDPFNGDPPAYIRARVWQYGFTSREQHRKTGNWWNRELDSELVSPIGLDAR